MTLVIEDAGRNPATPDNAAEWASSYGLTFPVLADPNNTGVNYIVTDPGMSGGYGLPNSQLLLPGLEVKIVNGSVSESDFLPSLAPE